MRRSDGSRVPSGERSCGTTIPVPGSCKASTSGTTECGESRTSGLSTRIALAGPASRTPRLMPAAYPTFADRTTRQSPRAATRSAVPSAEPLSTTTTSAVHPSSAPGRESSRSPISRELL